MRIRTYILCAATAILTLAAGCKSEDYNDGTTPLANAAFINVAEITPEARVTFKKNVDKLDRKFTVKLVSPAPEPTTVYFRIDETAVAAYNHRHATNYTLLPATYYDLPAPKTSIEVGKAESGVVTIHFKGLEQMEIDKTYLFPITLSETSSGIDILQNSGTVHYLVRRSSAITTAANLTGCYMWVPSFETPAGQAILKGLEAFTYEILVNVNEFDAAVNVSSIMGVEQHCLLRIGDSAYPRQQLQMQVGSVHFPSANVAIPGITISAGEWYHLAFTWDVVTQVAKYYVNGELQSSGRLPWDSEKFDINRVTTGGVEDKAYRFLIGYSYNIQRPLKGMVSEARVWSVARTQEEIFRNMYEVTAPQSKPELRAYWRFNEGEGNVVKDLSQYGNDAACLDGQNSVENGGRTEGTLKWDTSIEIPILNQ